MRFIIGIFAVIALLTAQTESALASKYPLVIDTDSISLASVSDAAEKRFGKTVLIEPDGISQVVVHGIDLESMTMGEFQAALSRNKLTVIKSEHTLLIARFASARQTSLPVIRDFDTHYDEWQWVTLVMETGKISAAQLVPLLRPLVQKEGHFSGSKTANSIIVTAPFGVVRRLYQIVEVLNSNID